MGVFYPVHVVLYRWLNTETAYVVSLVVHTLWGGLGAYWAARRLGTSRMGSALARVLLVDVRVLSDPPGPSVGLHDRMLDALGVGAGLSACCFGRARRRAGHPFLLSAGAGAPGLAGTLSTGVSHPMRAGADGGLGGRSSVCWRACASSAVSPRHLPACQLSLRGAASIVLALALGVSAGGDSARADRAAGSAGGAAARFRVPIRLCVDAVSPGQLRRSGAVPSLAAVAAAGLGPVSCHARGASDLRRAGSPSSWRA